MTHVATCGIDGCEEEVRSTSPAWKAHVADKHPGQGEEPYEQLTLFDMDEFGGVTNYNV